MNLNKSSKAIDFELQHPEIQRIVDGVAKALGERFSTIRLDLDTREDPETCQETLTLLVRNLPTERHTVRSAIRDVMKNFYAEIRSSGCEFLTRIELAA